jgi:hypothetical protein
MPSDLACFSAQVSGFKLLSKAGWDGDNPPGDRGLLCRSVLASQVISAGSSNASQLQTVLTGLAANLLVPMALKFTGMFWDIHGQYHVLEGLVQRIGSNTGHYAFKK